jgi:uncharacterized protein YprB with RNaseH-like and TPR domain
MDLRAKLAHLGKPAPAHALRPRGEVRAEERHALSSTPTPHGLLHTTCRDFADGATHGRVTLSDARRLRASTLALLALDDALAAVDPTRVLFVDTETTGLHGGAGTLPFLIGLGWFEASTFRVEQLFLPRPGQEGPMLRRLAERLSQASLMVTFNGKCFDWPLLRTRLVMNRLAGLTPPAHLDLLHCSRRVFRRRLSTMRLTDLERHVLGFHRVKDIDGAAIPAVYFDYLRYGRAAPLQQVLEHNLLDVVALAAVLAELSRRVETPWDGDAAEDCLSLAELHARFGQPECAESLAVLAAERAGGGRTAFEAWWLAARLAGRRRDWATMAHRLDTALSLPRLSRAETEALHLALARVCEHRLKDKARALHHARSGAAAEAPAAHAKRIARLSRQLNTPRRAFDVR